MNLYKQRKIGFVGTGNLSQAIIRGLIESQTLLPAQIYASNRSDKKLLKFSEETGIVACSTNENVIDQCDVIFLGMKPQDFVSAVEPIAMSFQKHHIVISLAAGIQTQKLESYLTEAHAIARVMVNTPVRVRQAVIGYCLGSKSPDSVSSTVEDLLSPLGVVIRTSDGEQMQAVAVSCAAGTAFVLELMDYWQDWLKDYGFDAETSRAMIVELFSGTAKLAQTEKDRSFEEIQSQIVSKKGMTAAGLESIRELEIERTLRYSFEKSALRDQELGEMW